MIQTVARVRHGRIALESAEQRLMRLAGEPSRANAATRGLRIYIPLVYDIEDDEEEGLDGALLGDMLCDDDDGELAEGGGIVEASL